MEQIASSLKVTFYVFYSKKLKEDVSHLIKEVERKQNKTTKHGIQEVRDS